jgi:HlyD family secretion protein
MISPVKLVKDLLTKASVKLAPDAADFSPGLLAIQESPPARLPRTVFYIVGALFAILLVWSIFGRVDIVASAEGRLVPKTFTKIVQPAEAGIVREILVEDGQEVKEGQVLIRMDATTAGADLSTLKNESILKSLTLRRIDAELAGKPFMMNASDPPQLFNQVTAQYNARRQAYLDALSQEQAALEKAKFDLVSAEQTLQKLRATLPLYRQAAQSYERLVKEGFVSEMGANDKIREKIEKEQDFKAQEANVGSLKQTITQSQKKLAQIKSNYESQLLNERIENSSLSQKAEGELTKQQFKSGLLALRAPQAGIVKDMNLTTIGTVVQPGAVLLNIVPKSEPLIAEVAIRNEDVGFVQAGQAAKVKLSAYPFQKYGLVEGTVEGVAADANVSDQKQNAQQPQTYKAYVKLKDQLLRAPNGEQLKLTAGMAVVSEIHQGKRSVIEYLLSPVQKVSQEAARER